MNEFRPLIEAEARQRRQERLADASRRAGTPRHPRRHLLGRAARTGTGTERLDG